MNKNKQELINELKRISLEKQHKALTHPESKNYYEGMVMAYSQVVHMVNTVLKLDEPKKPVVPQFVAEWFEENKDDLEFAIWELCVDSYNAEAEPGIIDWIQCPENNPIETLTRMKDGYEVEKEPLYMVPFLKDEEGNKKILVERNRQYDIIWGCENDGWCELFTEEQIKSVNEEYWKFAELYEVSEDKKE